MKSGYVSPLSGFLNKAFPVAIIGILVMSVVLSGSVSGAERENAFFLPVIRFAIIADPHFYDPELGMEGQAFNEVMAQEIKLFRYGKELLEAALLEVQRAGVDFVIIPGDLTKDGEMASHLKLADSLDELRNKGVATFVVPGNHDINNPDARSYPGEEPVPVQTVSPSDFAGIYDNHGYGNALFTDQDSLSYVVEPVHGLWLLAVDSCRYRENIDTAIVGGTIAHSTMNWIKTVLFQAELNNKFVIGFMHHALLENFVGHEELLPQFILDNHETVARSFAESGLQVMFTGHTHVQDITSGQWEDGTFLLDIQTGSILTYPHPYRIVTLRNGFMRINSRFITDIPGNFGENGFYEYSRSFMEISARQLAMDLGLFGSLPNLFANAYAAHAIGDEQPDEDTLRVIDQLTSSPFPPLRTAGHYLASVWSDLSPSDNDLNAFLPQGFRKMSGSVFHMWNFFRTSTQQQETSKQ